MLALPFQEARTTYRRILQESARKLNTQGSHLGSCIEKARPYYEARRLAKEVCLCFCYCDKLRPWGSEGFLKFPSLMEVRATTQARTGTGP